MKNIKYIVVLLATGFMASCNDFLDVDSPSSFDANYVFSNTTDAKKVLMGAYALFSEDAYTSRMSNVFMQNTDVEASGVSAAPDGSRRDVWSLQGALLPSFGDIKKAWDNNYLAIDRSNQCIEGILASDIVNNADMQMMLGEAYCLRAYRYFLLCNYWGDVPYYREAAKAGMQLDIPRTDKNIIYSGMIQDLVNCEGKMYFADEFSDGIERMNREWCIGLIARLSLFRAGYGMTKEGVMKRADDYLDVQNNDSLAVTYTINNVTKTARTYKEYYQLALDYCQYLMDKSDRPLNPNFQEVFDNESKWIKTVNDDVLYEVAFTSNNGGGDVGWCIGVTVNASSYGSGGSYIRFPTPYLYSFDEKDQRFPTTVSMVEYSNDDMQTAASFNSASPGKWCRLLLPSSPGSSSSKSTGINWPLMRYSDILLMLAEAENEVNGPTALAKSMLVKVRNRAFASADQPVKVNAYVDSVSSSKDAFFNAIVNERAWEFGGECIRKFDLVRWNLYGKKIHETRTALDNIGKAVNLLDLSNPDVAKYANYAPKLYYTRKAGKIIFLNTRWTLPAEQVPLTTVDADALSNDGSDFAQLGWCSNAYKKVTNTTTGEVTYESADYTVRTWRGYPESDYASGKAVPYLLPIATATVETSVYLDNNGYRLNE
jgi:starch-binding outer membrane protein, SusD/RagB family